jgi:hypothetical protein
VRMAQCFWFLVITGWRQRWEGRWVMEGKLVREIEGPVGRTRFQPIMRQWMKTAPSRESEVEFQAELNDPGVAACGDDAAKVTRIEDLARQVINATTWGEESIQIADRIREVRVVGQI